MVLNTNIIIANNNRRLQDEVRQDIVKTARSQTKTAIKKKEKLKERKQKREQKRKKGKDPEDKAGPGKRDELFGVQAYEPPTITALPRKAAIKKQLHQQQRAEEEASDHDDDSAANVKQKKEPKEIPEVQSVGRKAKLKTLPLAQQKRLLEEREKVIATYRQVKQLQQDKLAKAGGS
jgi:hypothetical protein